MKSSVAIMNIGGSTIPSEKLAAFCDRWRITELSLFGSVLSEEFSPDSDVDILVTFEAGHPWTLFDHFEMQEGLSELFEREVDLVSRRAVERSRNPLRKKAILDSAKCIYAAS